METKYIFIDIDGTLFDQEYGIPQSAIDAIQKARSNGHKAFICTGRPFKEVDDTFRNIGFDGYIFACGGLVEINQNFIYKETMPISQTKHIKQLLDANGIGYALEGIEASYFSKDAYECFYKMYYNDFKDDFKVLEQMKKVNFIKLEEDKQIDFNQIIKFSLYSKKEEIHDVVSQIQDAHIILHSLDFNGYINYEVTCPHINKATGIDSVLAHYGASKSQSIAIGDSMNDASMLSHCEIAISMGNACDEVKQISNFVTKHILEDGLHHAFKHFNLV